MRRQLRLKISIHASEKEATNLRFGIWRYCRISIHASAREATGADCKGRAGHCISIHASAREATVIYFLIKEVIQYFNPRLREGGDSRRKRFKDHAEYFNPRLREGGDISRIQQMEMDTYFNPRLREGGDPAFSEQLKAMSDLEFQSTPPRGRRHHPIKSKQGKTFISIHASAREATVTPSGQSRKQNHFNPRLREGGDTLIPRRSIDPIQFQSTPPRGRRLPGGLKRDLEA